MAIPAALFIRKYSYKNTVTCKEEKFVTQADSPTKDNSTPNYDGFYSADEVAKILDVEEDDIEQWRDANIFPEDVRNHKVIYLYRKSRQYEPIWSASAVSVVVQPY